MISAVPSENGGGRVTPIRDTSAQDRPIDPQPRQSRRRYKLIAAGGGGLLLLIVIGLLVSSWMSAEISVPRERVRIAEVTRGTFIRDVSAQGTVVAAVSPTLFAPATGTVHFLVQAGDMVKKGSRSRRSTARSCATSSQREQATLAGLEVAVQRQSIDTRRQLLANQQAIDLANVEHPGGRARAASRRGFVGQAADQRARLREGARRCGRGSASITSTRSRRRSCRRKASSSSCARGASSAIGSAWSWRICSVASTISNIKSPVDGVVGTLAVTERATVAAERRAAHGRRSDARSRSSSRCRKAMRTIWDWGWTRK